jgi:hypothetical protein
MKIFGLKKWLIVLVAFFGFASMGSAQNIGAGFHWGSGLVGGGLVVNFSKGFALRANVDLGLNNFQTQDIVASFGVDLSLNFRIPIVGDGSELYIGPGFALSGSGGNPVQFGIVGVFGLELQLSKGIAFFVEFKPLVLVFVPRFAFGLGGFETRTGLTFYF